MGLVHQSNRVYEFLEGATYWLQTHLASTFQSWAPPAAPAAAALATISDGEKGTQSTSTLTPPSVNAPLWVAESGSKYNYLLGVPWDPYLCLTLDDGFCTMTGISGFP